MVSNPKVDLDMMFKANLGACETLQIGMRISGVTAPSSSDEDIEKTRKAMSKQILEGCSNSFQESDAYLKDKLFQSMKQLRGTMGDQRKLG